MPSAGDTRSKERTGRSAAAPDRAGQPSYCVADARNRGSTSSRSRRAGSGSRTPLAISPGHASGRIGQGCVRAVGHRRTSHTLQGRGALAEDQLERVATHRGRVSPFVGCHDPQSTEAVIVQLTVTASLAGCKCPSRASRQRDRSTTPPCPDWTGRPRVCHDDWLTAASGTADNVVASSDRSGSGEAQGKCPRCLHGDREAHRGWPRQSRP